MGMGFLLPFALTFVAIPLESFVHSLRTVLGLLGVALLKAVGFGLRLLGNVARYAGVMSIHVYDLLIFAPLWIERQAKARVVSHAVHENEQQDTVEQPSFGGVYEKHA